MSTPAALVCDNGLFPYFATMLAEAYDPVYYYVPYNEAFPVFHKAEWGRGLQGVTRSHDFFGLLDKVDVVAFPDVGAGDLQMWLRERGHNVWGCGSAEVLELDREYLKRLMTARGMNQPPTWRITGTTALREHLEQARNKDQFVKISEFRGEGETFKHKDWWLTEPKWKALDHRLGALRERLRFVVEGEIPDAVEVGLDDYTVDGVFPSTTMYGYERKDTNYRGRVVPRVEVPEVLLETSEHLRQALGMLGCRSMFSTEVRVTEDGAGYLIDPSTRCPSPPSEAELEAYENWPEIVAAGAQGKLVDPVPRCTHVAEIVLRAEGAEEDTVALRFPKEFRRFVKLHGHVVVDGVDYVVHLGMGTIGAVVGIGDSDKEATEMALEVAKSVEADGLEYDEHGFDELDDVIEKGVARGVNWE